MSPYSMLYKAMKGHPTVVDAKLTAHNRAQQKPEVLKLMGNEENYKMIKQLLHGLEKPDLPIVKRREATGSNATHTMTTTASTATYQRHQRSSDMQAAKAAFPSLGASNTTASTFNGRRSSFGKKKRNSRQHAPSLTRNLKKPQMPERNVSESRAKQTNRGSQSTISTSGIMSQHPRVSS